MHVVVDRHIREVEVSITARCTLACRECGFFVPKQPPPAHGDSVTEISSALGNLSRLGVRIDSLAIVGGEPTIDARLLERAVRAVREIDIVGRMEVVSNGLTPRGVTLQTLAAIDRFTISVYGYDDAFLDAWRLWLTRVAPRLELCVRRSEDGWDAWSAALRVSPARAQEMFDGCWYRRHCVTLERGRLFSCSRIAKLARDDEGLLLTGSTTFADVEAYLHRPSALPSCSDCTPMMGLATVAPGVQPDDRIARLQRRAKQWLDAAIASREFS